MIWDFAVGLAIGLSIDLLIGWPAWLYRRIGHPVGWLARPISAMERRWNRSTSSNAQRFALGTLVSLAAILCAFVVWGLLAGSVAGSAWAPLVYGVLFWPLIAARSMHDHVAAIAKPLAAQDIQGARAAVSMIVGRDPNALDAAGIARASLESLGENTSDGIVAPMVWGLLLGPAGMAGYKAINTLDSMIAHRNPRYEWFGKTAARLDDIANLLPARLTGALYALASGRRCIISARIMLRDARQHRSPNAGWPETALAAGIGVRLSGPRSYGKDIAQEPWLNGAAPDPTAQDIWQGLRLYRRVLALIGLPLWLVACAWALG